MNLKKQKKKYKMNTKDFQCVVGELEKDKPAVIRFFGAVNEYTTANFNYEFLYIQEQIKPSKIQVQINSEGGSILHGMGTYSIINNCDIPTECVIEGMAASVASIIWAAGDVSTMRDYGILMIHNPFIKKEDVDDGCDTKVKAKQSPVIEAFRSQIQTIYTKRWGISETKVKAIMEGVEGQDGTFFDAEAAVAAGIIKPENVIKTTKQKAVKVKNLLSGVKNSIDCRTAMAEFIVAEIDENKLVEKEASSIKAEQGINKPEESKINNTQNSTKMNDENKLDLGLVAASLGEANLAAKDVIAHLTGLVDTKRKYEALVTTNKEVTETYNSLKIENAGNAAKVVAIGLELETAKASLSVFQAEKQALKDQETETMVQNAIDAGKIKKESKAEWVSMAATNFELVKSTLSTIASAEVITNAIAGDPVNKSAANEADKVKAQIDEALGANFKFPTSIN